MPIYGVSLILRVAAYIRVRLWPTHQLVGAAESRSSFVATPLSG